MIGKAHPGFEPRWMTLAFRPYLLNPDLDGLEPMPKLAHLEKKLGKPFKEMRSIKQLQENGKRFGLKYRFEAEDLASGTVDSHRLVQFVATVGGVEAAQTFRREVMRSFNEEGKALSDRDVLLSAVSKSGADADVAESILDSDAYRRETIWMDRESKKQGIDMVPHYRFHTPDGLHSVADYYEEWHFLDAIYRSFPDQTRSATWGAAAQAARDTVSVLDSSH
eukprot:CAMPEP_0197933252 /NCGR_PEP_ID=MMETSP1439-20131203/109851_1 /TAXON_ID=66791 /ORGANISM="Gonyaulax spinifera, Strain CCMP409" /LENGTH=221 /DNA_ID=CAMNT_0043556071 /DNA_START=62 /DNA_END=724 /DNA_ORIENTATION=+